MISDDTMMGLSLTRVVVIAIGTDFLPGCLEHLTKTMLYAADRGMDVGFSVIRNVCIRPNEGVPFMRNDAIALAMAGGWDYMLMVDNDILCDDHSLIVDLVRAGPPLIAPWYNQVITEEDGSIPRVQSPMVYPHQGIIPLNWISINCVLFHVGALRAAGGPTLIPEAIVTNKEEHIFRKFELVGFRLWQNTNTFITLLRPPTQTWKKVGEANPNPDTPENRDVIGQIYDEMALHKDAWRGEDEILYKEPDIIINDGDEPDAGGIQLPE